MNLYPPFLSQQKRSKCRDQDIIWNTKPLVKVINFWIIMLDCLFWYKCPPVRWPKLIECGPVRILIFMRYPYNIYWIAYLSQEYNDVSVDMRDDEDTKGELHQRLEVYDFLHLFFFCIFKEFLYKSDLLLLMLR